MRKNSCGTTGRVRRRRREIQAQALIASMPVSGTQQWRRAHWARSGLGPTLNTPSRARSGQIRTGQVRPGSYL